jgi:hypothetical protein
VYVMRAILHNVLNGGPLLPMTFAGAGVFQ